MNTTEHLQAIKFRLRNERQRLAMAKTDDEKKMRAVWVKGIEKELESEKEFLRKRGVNIDESENKISDKFTEEDAELLDALRG